MHSAPELTARVRIRNAAVQRFAREGFAASVRSIAEDAGVSAALVIHHFGSKEALREACDEFMLAEIRKTKHENVDQMAAGGSLLELLSRTEEFSPMLGYILRSLEDGGPVGKAFIGHMVEDAVGYTREAVEQGLVHPSLDEVARARYLTHSALGALLLEFTLHPPEDPSDLNGLVRQFLQTSYQPMLELYSQGFFTTTRLFEDYLRYVADPPEP